MLSEDDITQLESTFGKFCAFGRGSVESLDQTLDGTKFAKLARDTNLLDKKITSIEIDIIFNKVKPKNERRITFKMFKDALEIIATKKYPKLTPEEAYEKVVKSVCAESPSVKGTPVKADPILNRLTDVSGYTGTHKNRFDATGKGLGLAGRGRNPSSLETHVKTAELSQLVDRSKRTNSLTQSEESLGKNERKNVAKGWR